MHIEVDYFKMSWTVAYIHIFMFKNIMFTLLMKVTWENNCLHDLLFFFKLLSFRKEDKSSSETEWINGRQNGCCICAFCTCITLSHTHNTCRWNGFVRSARVTQMQTRVSKTPEQSSGIHADTGIFNAVTVCSTKPNRVKTMNKTRIVTIMNE